MSQVLLHYTRHPPSKNPTCSILLIGMEGIGKGILAKQLVDVPADFNIFCHTATTLDQIKETASQSRIDYIIFMVDTSRKISLDTTKVILEYIDVQYFLGKACFVVPRRGNDLSYEDEGLMDLAAKYSTQVMYVNIGMENDVMLCAGGVVKMAGVAAGMTSGVTSLLLA